MPKDVDSNMTMERTFPNKLAFYVHGTREGVLTTKKHDKGRFTNFKIYCTVKSNLKQHLLCVKNYDVLPLEEAIA